MMRQEPRTYPARMHVYEAADGWRWRLKAQNGNVIADSGQAYKSKRNATDAARMVARVGIVMDGEVLR